MEVFMILRKIVLLAIVALPLAGCDSKKPEADTSYQSQSDILNMQEEEYSDVPTSGDDESGVSTSSGNEQRIQEEEEIQTAPEAKENWSDNDPQLEEFYDEDYTQEPIDDSEKIDNTSSEADDTIY